MNRLTLIIILILNWHFAHAQESSVASSSEVGDVTIELTKLESDEGQLMVALYSSKDTWLDKLFLGELVQIENNKATVVFRDVPYGIYAASAVHDKDKNNELNTGLFGIPTEPYASSRGAFNRFGPPKWEDAKFTVDSKTVKEAIVFR